MARRKAPAPPLPPPGPRGEKGVALDKLLDRDAYEAGRRAFEAHESVDQPPGYAAVSLVGAWVAGWRDAHENRLERHQAQAAEAGSHAPPPRVAPTPEVRTVPPPEAKRREPDAHFWPEGHPMPGRYKRARTPCPGCRRLLMGDGSLAAVVTNSHAPVVDEAGRPGPRMNRFRCRACDHRWKLPVE